MQWIHTMICNLHSLKQKHLVLVFDDVVLRKNLSLKCLTLFYQQMDLTSLKGSLHLTGSPSFSRLTRKLAFRAYCLRVWGNCFHSGSFSAIPCHAERPACIPSPHATGDMLEMAEGCLTELRARMFVMLLFKMVWPQAFDMKVPLPSLLSLPLTTSLSASNRIRKVVLWSGTRSL